MRPRTIDNLHGTLNFSRADTTSAMPKRSAQIDDHPDVVRMCVECKSTTCSGGDCVPLQRLKKRIKDNMKAQTGNSVAPRMLVEYKGRMVMLKHLADEYGVTYSKLYSRIFKQHMSVEKALLLPERRR